MLILLAPTSPVRAAAWSAAPQPAAEADCLAEAIFYEAGGERREGREAVAQVVLNRLHDPAYPKTVCGVVFEGAARTTGCQFTFTCDGARLRRRPEGDAWRDAQAMAADALGGRLASEVGASTHYHAVSIRPAWSLAMTPTLRIGGHQFYTGEGRAGFVRHASTIPAAAPPPQPTAFSVWGLQIAVVTPQTDGGARVSSR